LGKRGLTHPSPSLRKRGDDFGQYYYYPSPFGRGARGEGEKEPIK